MVALFAALAWLLCGDLGTVQAQLTLTRYGNTAFAGVGSANESVAEAVPSCTEDCSAPNSLRLTGQFKPSRPGQYGFNVSFDPPLPYPSDEAYCRLWVHDHLLFPRTTAGRTRGRAGAFAPLWIPLPPRALNATTGSVVEHAGAAPLTSYELRFEYVCMAKQGCIDRSFSIHMAEFAGATSQLGPWQPIPEASLLPQQGDSEVKRRNLYTQLQQGWGTFYHRSMTTWALLPESLTFGVGLFRQSTGAYLAAEGLTLAKPQIFAGAEFAISVGPHSYNQSYAELTLKWFAGGGLNITIAATVDSVDNSQLTLQATVNNAQAVECSDYLLIVSANFTHGRSGDLSAAADGTSVSGVGAGLRSRTLWLLHGAVGKPTNRSAIPSNAVYLAASLGDRQVTLATYRHESAASVTAKTAAYRARQRATLAPYGSEWGDVKDAIQTALMWSFMYDPREGLVAPMFQFQKGGLYSSFSDPSVDGDTTMALFCWDGSFASYQLSLDALDLSLSNLIQIIKMRTSAGFVPSYAAGTVKSRDRSNPPVTAKVLNEITKRWGVAKTKWVVELCFDDLLEWNTWMFENRREVPLGLMSWGSNSYPYAPDGSPNSLRGSGRGGGDLESGLDNSVLGGSFRFNETGLMVQDGYDAGYSGMYLMDCLAQIELAKMIGRTSAIPVLQSRFDEVNAQLPKLWNEEAGYFQNVHSEPGMRPVDQMAPTNFYPLLVGPEKGPTEQQVAKTVRMHLTNRSRFGVWPSAVAPTEHPMPPREVRALVQWYSEECGGPHYGCPGSPHQLCCKLDCNAQNNPVPGSYIQRLHAKIRFEGLGLPSVPADQSEPASTLVELIGYNCTGLTPNASDLTMNVRGWKPRSIDGTDAPKCDVMDGGEVAMYVHKNRTGPSAADLIPLELWYRPGDHYLVASAAGIADAKSHGYVKQETLGYVWPPPGSVPGVASRYGLPSISKDDRAYVDQDYWHGRIWAPMIQLTYWGLEQYSSPEARGAAAGLVQQSRALLLRNWLPEPHFTANDSAAGLGSYTLRTKYVFENYGADDGEGYAWTGSACPLYSWGGLTGFIGLQHAGFYSTNGTATPIE